jgi:VanZ family protein
MNLLRNALFIFYMLAITVLSLLPGDDMPSVPVWDKLLHLGAYMMMTIFLAMSSTSRKQLIEGLPLIFLWSLCIEIGQNLSGDRLFELMDGLANLLGLLLGLGVCLLIELTPARRWLFAKSVY